MQTILVPIGMGTIVSLAVFLFFEKQAIEAKRQSEKNGLDNSNISLPENFRRYNTEKNVLLYFIIMFLFTLGLSYTEFFQKELSLIDVFLYIFSTTFIGSTTIFVLKFQKSILIKVFAAFLYGAPLIASSALGFIASYIVYTLK
ncbi:hypothetical protein ACKGJI_04070 [Sulfurospirillum sp. 1307]|jgi:hypothetical protein